MRRRKDEKTTCTKIKRLFMHFKRLKLLFSLLLYDDSTALNIIFMYQSRYPDNDQANNGKPLATITGDFEFNLLIQIKIEVRRDYVLVQVQGSPDAKIEAKARWNARGAR